MLRPSGVCDIHIKPRDATPDCEWSLVGGDVTLEFSTEYEDYQYLPTLSAGKSRKIVTLTFALEYGEYTYKVETKQEKRARLIKEMYPQ